jgi:hypothetical protein
MLILDPYPDPHPQGRYLERTKNVVCYNLTTIKVALFYHVFLVGGGDILNIILIIRNNQQRKFGNFPVNTVLLLLYW